VWGTKAGDIAQTTRPFQLDSRRNPFRSSSNGPKYAPSVPRNTRTPSTYCGDVGTEGAVGGEPDAGGVELPAGGELKLFPLPKLEAPELAIPPPSKFTFAFNASIRGS
jgi:hypothetical protein